MSGSQPLNAYALSVAQQDVSPAMMPESRPRLVNTASRRIVSVASQSGTVQPGQSLLFQLPANMGSGFLVSGSAYIKFRIRVTQAVGYSWSFKQSGSGSSVFQRVSAILSGQQVESIQMYNKLYHNLLLHATSLAYCDSDASIHEGAFTVHASEFVTVCVPIALSVLNARQHLPLFLLSSALLQFDTESLLNAITQLSVNAVTNYEISEASVCFEQLVPEPAYEQGIKAMLASRVYQMSLDTWHNSRYGHQASLTMQIGVNSSSVRAILWGSVPPAGQTASGNQKASDQTSCQVFADGALVHNSRLVCDSAGAVSESFAEMQRCLGTMFDVSRTSTACASNGDGVAGQQTAEALSRASYYDRAFLGGLSLTRETRDNSSFSFVGLPVQNLTISWQGTAIAGGEFFTFVALQQILTIDMTGNVNLIR